MNILLTNDDGIDAGGLKSLAEVFKREHEVWIVAPLKNKSGASSSITMDRELLIEQRAKNEYALDGSPVDCVLSSVNGSYLPSKPDVIISGINSGPNIGTDIVYSGTCAAARQGAIYGIPSIALSLEKKTEENSYKFDALAEFALKNLKNLETLNNQLMMMDDQIIALENAANFGVIKATLGKAMKVLNDNKITVEELEDEGEALKGIKEHNIELNQVIEDELNEDIDDDYLDNELKNCENELKNEINLPQENDEKLNKKEKNKILNEELF